MRNTIIFYARWFDLFGLIFSLKKLQSKALKMFETSFIVFIQDLQMGLCKRYY